MVFYYQIPVLTFSIIGTFFMVQGYFWSIIGMIINDNLGFLPKKTERTFNIIYAFFVVLGIVFLIFDFSKIIPFPRGVVDYFDSLPGLNLRASLKIFAAHWVSTGWGGLRKKIEYYRAFNAPADTSFYDGELEYVIGVQEWIVRLAAQARRMAE